MPESTPNPKGIMSFKPRPKIIDWLSKKENKSEIINQALESYYHLTEQGEPEPVNNDTDDTDEEWINL